MTIIRIALLVSLLIPSVALSYSPAPVSIATEWSKQVSPDNALPEYPRPALKRDCKWQNLNGLWDYAITKRTDSRPENFDGQILVPFCVESSLSGVGKAISEDQTVWYHRTFTLDDQSDAKRWLLHFDAVDYEADIWLNGKYLGCHRGGYDPFTFDISSVAVAGENEIILSVWDPTDKGNQQRGKQVLKPKGIYYTATTGIWQTVWLERVPQTYIENLRITPDVDSGTVAIKPSVLGPARSYKVKYEIKCDGEVIASAMSGLKETATMEIPNAKLWSPDSPFLYDLDASVIDNSGKALDSVQSYVGMRKISFAKDTDGFNRLMLNNKPLFQYGPLDQGYWPAGTLTPPTYEALVYDLEILKKMGFNMLRKHIKIEPQMLYYWCDKNGLLIWQDMPSAEFGRKEGDLTRKPESARQYERELKRMLDHLHNHPSIVMWVPFNEAWGQFDTARITEWIKSYDPSRLVNNASGWHDQKVGDIIDKHSYPGPAMFPTEENRVSVLGEFGGLGLPVEGHTWIQSDKNWGYRTYNSEEELAAKYQELMAKLPELKKQGPRRRSLHTNQRRRNRSKRPDDLRPQDHQDPGRAAQAMARKALRIKTRNKPKAYSFTSTIVYLISLSLKCYSTQGKDISQFCVIMAKSSKLTKPSWLISPSSTHAPRLASTVPPNAPILIRPPLGHCFL